MITDRHGEPLAISTPVESVWASPQKTEATPRQIRNLAQALSMSTKEVAARLSDTEREFVYLKRQLPPDQAVRNACSGNVWVAVPGPPPVITRIRSREFATQIIRSSSVVAITLASPGSVT